MATASLETGSALAGALLRLLHEEAPAAEFAALLEEAKMAGASESGDTAPVEVVRMAMAVRNRLDLGQQREAGMLAVIESARDLSGRLDLKELLGAITSRARRLLGSHLAWLSAYDSRLDAFHVVASDGALARSTGDMVAASDRGVVSVVVATRLPFTTPDYLNDDRFPHDPQLDSTFRDEGIAAVVGVPLLWDDEVTGLLFVADRYHRTHTAQNISILSTLATHAAVAMKNAMAFEQSRAALESAHDARAELEAHMRNVQSAAEAHEQMTSLLARGASLPDICQAVAQLMHGSVLVLDEAAQVIGRGCAAGYTGTGAASYEPHGEGNSALVKALRHSRQVGRSVVAHEADGEICRVNAVIAGSDVLGSVLLFRAQEPDGIAIRTFERSTSIIGIVLLSRERLEATRHREQSLLLRALTSPRQDDLPLLRQRADRLGVDLSRPVCLLLLETGDPDPAGAARQLHAAGVPQGVVFDEIDGALMFLFPAIRAQDIRSAMHGIANSHFAAAWRGVLSRPVNGPGDVPALHAALRRALPILGRLGAQGRIVQHNELTLYATLFESHDQAGLDAFLQSTVGALIAHDGRRGTSLTATLLAYFECNKNATQVAQRLNIHVNTVRQRLASIEDLLGHWGNASRALELHMALKLWSLSGDGRAPAAEAAR